MPTAEDPEDVVQFAGDAQLDTMGALAMIRFARKFDGLELRSSELSSSSGKPKEMSLPPICVLAEMLCGSTFFKTLPPRAQLESSAFGALPAGEYASLMKLRRRLWRLVHYITDANTLVQDGFSIIKSALDDKLNAFVERGTGFEIVWVGNIVEMLANHGRQYGVTGDPSDHFRELLQTYKITVNAEKLENDGFTSLKSVWKDDRTIRPFLHCEPQLVEYLQKNDITVWENTIGVICVQCLCDCTG